MPAKREREEGRGTDAYRSCLVDGGAGVERDDAVDEVARQGTTDHRERSEDEGERE